MDGYTGHLIGAPFSLLETVCVGDLGDRTHGDRICWDLFGKPTEKTRMVRRKTRGKVTKEILALGHKARESIQSVLRECFR